MKNDKRRLCGLLKFYNPLGEKYGKIYECISFEYQAKKKGDDDL